jgi:alpha-L-fucosidase
MWALASFAASSTPHVYERLPKPYRDGVPPSKLYDYGVMGPPATPAIVAAALDAVTNPLPKGPFKPTWNSIEQNYRTPSWFEPAKFGIFLTWGIYSVPAHHNEWYEKYMYSQAGIKWHEEHYGPIVKFGYKNFIPMFTAAKWNPDSWAALFKKAGAKYVILTAEHHDNFALWNSKVTPYNAVKMGPHRDLVGNLAKAVREQGLKFGVSNHGMEHFTFVNPTWRLAAQLKAAHADLFNPKWENFYNVADRSNAAMTRFLTDWVNRNLELINLYHPDMLWFDNAVNLRVLDPLKEFLAAYYYNRARQWGKQVSISTKYIAYAPSNNDRKQIGSIIDFEKVGPRSPHGIWPSPWQVDEPIGTTWGYTKNMSVKDPGTIIYYLVDTVSKGGNLLLNLSPMANGILPQAQQDTLLEVGKWLDLNGKAIYGTRPWTQFGEGGRRGFRFTSKGDILYAIALSWPGNEAVITALATANATPVKVRSVSLLGHQGQLEFTQDATGLKIKMPAKKPCDYAYVLKITGLKLHGSI